MCALRQRLSPAEAPRGWDDRETSVQRCWFGPDSRLFFLHPGVLVCLAQKNKHGFLRVFDGCWAMAVIWELEMQKQDNHTYCIWNVLVQMVEFESQAELLVPTVGPQGLRDLLVTFNARKSVMKQWEDQEMGAQYVWNSQRQAVSVRPPQKCRQNLAWRVFAKVVQKVGENWLGWIWETGALKALVGVPWPNSARSQVSLGLYESHPQRPALRVLQLLQAFGGSQGSEDAECHEVDQQKEALAGVDRTGSAQKQVAIL